MQRCLPVGTSGPRCSVCCCEIIFISKGPGKTAFAERQLQIMLLRHEIETSIRRSARCRGFRRREEPRRQPGRALRGAIPPPGRTPRTRPTPQRHPPPNAGLQGQDKKRARVNEDPRATLLLQNQEELPSLLQTSPRPGRQVEERAHTRGLADGEPENPIRRPGWTPPNRPLPSPPPDPSAGACLPHLLLHGTLRTPDNWGGKAPLDSFCGPSVRPGRDRDAPPLTRQWTVAIR